MTSDPAADPFTALAATAKREGVAPAFAELCASLATRRRWHALFDARLLEARHRLGLPLAGDLSAAPQDARDALEQASLAACREVGWPLLDEGRVAAGWMYLRAAAEPTDVAAALAKVADRLDAPREGDDPAADESLQELIHVALWEGVDPALGLRILLARSGTCNTITAYEQAVSRLPALRQQPAARLLVAHLHDHVAESLAGDLARRGLRADQRVPEGDAPIAELLAAADGLEDGSIHVDVSHLQSVLRIARVCTDRPTLSRAWDLAGYACRLPSEVVYPGEPPFEQVGPASRAFFGAQLGHDVEGAVALFRRAAIEAKVAESGTLPADVLVLLLWRLGRPAEALHAALDRPADEGMPSALSATGMLPSLVELASAAGDHATLQSACRRHGDEITFMASLAAERAAAAR
ncbi:MAG: hypothetical protein KGQ61_11805 [Planctomycetes bacterium]|nr:hypothetical protein [Planctomycetota bacterium]